MVLCLVTHPSQSTLCPLQTLSIQNPRPYQFLPFPPIDPNNTKPFPNQPKKKKKKNQNLWALEPILPTFIDSQSKAIPRHLWLKNEKKKKSWRTSMNAYTIFLPFLSFCTMNTCSLFDEYLLASSSSRRLPYCVETKRRKRMKQKGFCLKDRRCQ